MGNLNSKANKIISNYFNDENNHYKNQVYPLALSSYINNISLFIEFLKRFNIKEPDTVINKLTEITKSSDPENIEKKSLDLLKHIKNIDFKENPLFYVIYALVGKRKNQFYGSAIVSSKNANISDSVELITTLITITDIIDTITDYNPQFVNKSLEEKIKHEYIFFNYYYSIFSSNKPQDLHEFKEELLFLNELVNKSKNLIRKLKIEEIIVKKMSDEVKRYINGVILMDNDKISNLDDYIKKVSSKVSNLSVLGLIDLSNSQKDLNSKEADTFIETVHNLHTIHIAQDDLADIDFDIKNNQQNIWNITSKDNLINVLLNKTNRFILDLNQLNISIRNHWLFIYILMMLYYGNIVKEDQMNTAQKFYELLLNKAHNVLVKQK